MTKGKIKSLLDSRNGFIETEKGEELFFHSNNLEEVEFNDLYEGQEVKFKKAKDPNGRSIAVKVKLIEEKRKGSGEGTGEEGGYDSGGFGDIDM